MFSIHLRVNLLNVFFVRLSRECRVPYLSNTMRLTPSTEPSITHHVSNDEVIFLSVKSGLFLVFNLFGDAKFLSKVLTKLYLSKTNILRLEQDTLRNDAELVQLHRLDVEVLITKELEVRVLRVLLKFCLCSGHFFSTDNAVVLEEGTIFQCGVSDLVFRRKSIRKYGTDLNIKSKVTWLIFILLDDYSVVHYGSKLNTVCPRNVTDIVYLNDVSKFLSKCHSCFLSLFCYFLSFPITIQK